MNCPHCKKEVFGRCHDVNDLYEEPQEVTPEQTIEAIKKFCVVGIGKGNKGFKHEYERGIRKMAQQVLKLIKELEQK